ncbi:MAG: trypsin-like serine protease [Smithella sp.]|nr:trypsin-like serine protease [Smithella sp.]
MSARNRFVFRLIIVVLVFFLVWLAWQNISDFRGRPALQRDAAPRTVTARGDLADDEKVTIELFEKAKDSVVFITTRALVRDFWTRNVFSVPRGTGSGFIWDDAGHVITNYHVIEGASEAIVKLSDGSDYKASLTGASPAHDIAVLRISAGFKRPSPVPLGTSGDLRVGQKVFAIGNPFGLDWTLTTGIVSALDRSLSGENGTIEHLIQTDAAINPGNSGGPLLDSAGRLIGINTAIYSPSGASAGIGFAVPVDTLNRVVPQLIKSGAYTRPSLGVELDERINQRLKAALKVEGVVILKVPAGSAALRAGLQGAKITADGELIPGDIITAADGRQVDTVGKLNAALDERTAGETFNLTISRGGKTMEIPVVLQSGK